MLNDWHVHTNFSSDSDERMENVIGKALDEGMTAVCFTDHYDMMYPTGEFNLDTETYIREMNRMRDRYLGRCGIYLGVEMGLLPGDGISGTITSWLHEAPLDFAIGSVHLMNGTDPYDREQIDLQDDEMYRQYFACVLDNVRSCGGFQSLGHLDYVVRYGYRKADSYVWEDCLDIIDEILKELISRGIALEVNTAGIRQGLGFPNPHPGILKRYRQLGGEMVTVGSDAHRSRDVGYAFDRIPELLLDAGFRFVTEFYEKTAHFIPIDT